MERDRHELSSWCLCSVYDVLDLPGKSVQIQILSNMGSNVFHIKLNNVF